MGKKRLEYIDAVRGLTMFLVVSQHITTFWGDWDSVALSLLDQTLMTFRMPLFFFISGFIAYKGSEFWNTVFFKQRMTAKAKVQLIPAVVFSILFALCYGHEPLGFLRHGFGFFWFTPVLFGMFCIYFPCCQLLRKHPKALDLTLIAIALIAAMPLFRILRHFIPIHPVFTSVLRLDGILYYFEFFILGHFVHKYEKQAFALLSNDWLNCAAILTLVASMLLLMPTGISWGKSYPLISKALRFLMGTYIARYAGLFIIFAFFVRQRDYFAEDGRLSQTMQYVGRHTLDIYMLHSFFLPMKIDMVHAVVKAASQNVITQFVVEGVSATVIIAVCLLISNVLRNSNFLAHYLFGVKRTAAIKE